MLISFLPSVSSAAEIVGTGKIFGSNLMWTVTADGTMRITGSGEIPAGGLQYRVILANNYKDNEKLLNTDVTSVIIESGVTGISGNFFDNMTECKSIVIPETVKKIGEGVFMNCYNLTDIVLPNGISEIAERTFYGCSSLKNIKLPDSITVIGESAFERCSSLESVSVPKNVKTIGNEAFRGCSALKSISIAEGIKSIGAYAFYECKALEKVLIPTTVTSIDQCAFQKCESLKSIKFSAGMTELNSEICSDCISLSSVEIPQGITLIGYRAFYNCKSLKNIEIPKGVTTLESSVFGYCTALENVNLPNSIIEMKDSIFVACCELKSIQLPSRITSIDALMFYGAALESITIPDSVTSIEYGAFSSCHELRDVYFTGTEGQWKKIDVDATADLNKPLLNATVHYIPKPQCNHDYKAVTTPATCAKEGKTVYTCSECGDTYVDVIQKKPHKWNNGIITKAATTMQSGIRTYTCTVCKETLSETIPKIEIKNTKDNASGISVSYPENAYANDIILKVTKQSDTANYSVENYVKVTAYDIKTLINGKVSQPGVSVTVNIPLPTGYNAATTVVYHIENNGSKTKVNATVKNGVITITANSFSVYLIVDESSKVSVKLGDVDGDGKISAADARLVLRRSVGLENYKEGSEKFLACDVDFDGKVSAADARLILRASVGLEDAKTWKKA